MGLTPPWETSGSVVVGDGVLDAEDATLVVVGDVGEVVEVLGFGATDELSVELLSDDLAEVPPARSEATAANMAATYCVGESPDVLLGEDP